MMNIKLVKKLIKVCLGVACLSLISQAMAQDFFISQSQKPDAGAILTSGNSDQVTMSVSSTIAVARLFVRFYTGGNCTSGFNNISLDTAVVTYDLDPAKSYRTTDASWYAMCNQGEGFCGTLFSGSAIELQWLNASGASIGSSVCYSAHLQNSGGTACSSSSDCGLSIPVSNWVVN